MGLFSGFRRIGEKGEKKKKKLSKPAPAAVQTRQRPIDVVLFSDDPYLRGKKSWAQDHDAQALGGGIVLKEDVPAAAPDPWLAKRDLVPRLAGGGIASARSSLDLLTRLWTSGSEASLPHSLSVGNVAFGKVLDSSEGTRPSTAHGSESKPWVNQDAFASRFNATYRLSQSLPPMSFALSTHPRDGAQLRENASDNEASIVSSVQRSCSFDEQANQQPPQSPPSPISSVFSDTARLPDNLGATGPSLQGSATLKNVHPTAVPETVEGRARGHKVPSRTRDADRLSSSPVVASAAIAVNPKFIKNVCVAAAPRDTKARDAAKKKDLAIKVPRKNWSMKIEELERSWLEEQLSLGGHAPGEQNFDKVRQQQQPQSQSQSPRNHPQNHPPRQASHKAPLQQQQQQQQQQERQKRQPGNPMPHQHRQPRPQQSQQHQQQLTAWDDEMMASSSWQYPVKVPRDRHPQSARGYRPGMRETLLSSDASPMVNQWSDHGPGGRLPYGRQPPALRGSHSMQNLSRGYQERPVPYGHRDPRGWQARPPPRGGHPFHRGGMAAQGQHRDVPQKTNEHQAYHMANARPPMCGRGPYPRSPYPHSPASPWAAPSSRNEPLDSSTKGSFDLSLHGYPSPVGSVGSSPMMDSHSGHSPMSPPWRRPPANLRWNLHDHRSVSTPLERMTTAAPPSELPRYMPGPATSELTASAPWAGEHAATATTSSDPPDPVSPSTLHSHSEQAPILSPSSNKSIRASLTEQASLTEEQLNRLTIDSFPLPSPMRHRPSVRWSQGPDRSLLSSPTTVASVFEKDEDVLGPRAEAEEVNQNGQVADDKIAIGLEQNEDDTAKGEAKTHSFKDEDGSFESTSLGFFDVLSPNSGKDLDEDLGKHVVGEDSVDGLSEEVSGIKTPTCEVPFEETPAEEGSVHEHIIRWDTPIQGWNGNADDGEGFPELSSLSPLSMPAGDAEPSAKANWPLLPSVLASVAIGSSRPTSTELESVKASFLTGLETDTPVEERDDDPDDDGPGKDEEWGLEEAVLANSPFKPKAPFTASIYRKEIGAGPYTLEFPPGGPVSVFDVSTGSSASSTPSPTPEKRVPWVAHAWRQDSLDHHCGIKRAATTTEVKTAAVSERDESAENVQRHVPSSPPRRRSYDWAPEEASTGPISPDSIGLARGLSICESYDMLVGVASSTPEGLESEATSGTINAAVKKGRRMAGFHHYMHSSTSLWSSSTDGMDVVDGLDRLDGADEAEGQHGVMTAGVFSVF